MALDYNKRLNNLQKRKYDSTLNESLTAKNFSSNEIPGNVKYMWESMRAIDKKYNDRTLLAADRVKDHLEAGLNLHFSRAYKRQGSVETETNIKAHSDVDLLAVVDRYHFLAPDLPNENPYTDSDPNSDIRELRRQSYEILSRTYTQVDNSNEKCISILNKDLGREVDIVFAFWYNISDYQRTNDIYYRGIKIGSRSARVDYPFAHIRSVNHKGINTNQGSKKGIRLLKSLVADSDTAFNLVKSFQLTTIVHSIDDALLAFNPGNELDIAQAISGQLNLLINHSEHRLSIKSPNGCENPLTEAAIVPELINLKSDLDELITDASKELYSSYSLKSRALAY